MSTETQEIAPEVPAVVPAVSQPPAPEPAPAPAKQEPAKQKQEPAEAIEYEPSGDAGLDYALSFLSKAGIGPEDPALIAASDGDFGLLEAILAQKGIPGWEQAVNLGKQAQARFKEQAAAAAEKVTAAVTEVATSLGVDWEASVQWARDNATDEEKEVVNQLLAKPETAKIAALYLAYGYSQATGVTVAPSKTAVAGDAPVHTAAATGQIDRVEFAREAGKLHKIHGDAYSSTPQYAALVARLKR